MTTNPSTLAFTHLLLNKLPTRPWSPSIQPSIHQATYPAHHSSPSLSLPLSPPTCPVTSSPSPPICTLIFIFSSSVHWVGLPEYGFSTKICQLCMYVFPFPFPTPPPPLFCVCCVCVHIQNHSDNLPASWGCQENFTLMWDNPWLRHFHTIIMSSRRLW